jgi:hypothetical protein
VTAEWECRGQNRRGADLACCESRGFRNCDTVCRGEMLPSCAAGAAEVVLLWVSNVTGYYNLCYLRLVG